MKKIVMILVLVAMSICSGCGWANMMSYDREETITKIKNATTIAELKALDKVGSIEVNGVGILDLSQVDIAASRILDAKMRSIRENDEIKLAKEDRQKRIDYVKSKGYVGLDRDIGYAIINKSYCIGMTTTDALASMGYPGHGINKTVGSWGTHEQWVYGYAGYKYNTYGPYLYFENGILTSYQN